MLSIGLFLLLWTAYLTSEGLKTQQAHQKKPQKNTTIITKWRKNNQRQKPQPS